MSKRVSVLCGSVCLFIAACASNEVKAPVLPWVQSKQQAIVYNAFLADVLDYEDSSRNEIPTWVSGYLNGEDIEKLPQYHDKYLFVSKQTVNDIKSQGQLSEEFSTEKDFPSLIAARVQKRLNLNLYLYPDAVYGAFFEEAVKAFYDAEFEGVFREDDFWIKRREAQEEGADREVIDFLTLLSADRSSLVSQVKGILDSVKPSEKLDQEQAAAVMHVKNVFFDGF
ncbi:MAG: hypothetical protein LBH75_05510 [Treponema sp.]|jgi:hypothetical protein|nr:hypothetical protein [Treponema sp.]